MLIGGRKIPPAGKGCGTLGRYLVEEGYTTVQLAAQREPNVVDLKSIDERTNLAGSNRLELLMFSLRDQVEGQIEPLYAINVFKVREIMVLPPLISVPNSHEFMVGVANIRGIAIPVIDLTKFCGYEDQRGGNILIVTEFNSSTQGFMVHDVDNIIQLDWNDIHEPPAIIKADNNNALTAMSKLPTDQMLLIIDVEKILAEVLGSKIDLINETEMPFHDGSRTVFFCDDSKVARAQVGRMLDKMGILHTSAKNGLEALLSLKAMADEAESKGESLIDSLQAIITDVEMPEMDGYVLTSKIKADPRFNGIPVMMHSSLSARENRRLGEKVGADVYIAKLQPDEFSRELEKYL